MKTTNDIISKMNAKYAGMSKGQKILSTYISDHPEKAAFLTAAKLGEQVGVSESTVVRFAIFLGYKGYPQFQKSLEEVVLNKLDNKDEGKVYYGQIKKSRILKSVLGADAERIKETLAEIDEVAFKSAVNTIAQAKTVYIIGLRSCAPLAQFMGFHLGTFFDDVRVIETGSASEVFEKLLHISERDVIVAISFPRYSMLTLKALEFANERSAKVITLTDSVHSPMNLYSSCNLLARCDMSSIVESMVAPMSVINALIIALSMRRQKELVEAMDTMETVFEDMGVSGNDELEYINDRVRFVYDKSGTDGE
ncbi:MAG: MurR/RpiR family transcriptional regulator [Eubacterium sp.]|nr:MurR/RpiR family transcriptional regulator [Eubacterium sp.]